MSTDADFAVVGGGLLGLTLALRLGQRGHRVILFEASPEPGGLASSWQLDGVRWDRFYHVILRSDRALLALLTELELEGAVVWRQTRTGFYANGRLYSVSDSLEFLRFPALSLADKVRLAATIAYAARIKNWQRLERIPIEQWLVKLSGRSTYERFWRPLLRAKLGENYRNVSAAFIWATIARMYSARGRGLKRETFGYVRGGYATVLSRLTDRLRSLAVQLRLGEPVASVWAGESGTVSVRTAGGKTVRCRKAVLTVPTPVAARLCSDLRAQERERLSGLAYQGVVCASLLLREPLGPYYITNITDDGLPFTGVIEMGALVDRSELGGRSLVYLPRYLSREDPLWNCDDSILQDQFLRGLRRMYPDFDPRLVEAFRIARARYVQALPVLEYSRRWAPPMTTSVPNVFLTTGAQIVNGTLNANETVGLAESAAKALLGQTAA